MTVALVAIAVGGVLALVIGGLGHRDLLAPQALDVEELAGRNGLVLTPRVEVAARRLLARHRSWRFHGGAAGALFAYVVGVTRPDGFSIGVGIGGAYFPDLLVCVLAGVLGGVIAAESHHLRPSRSSGPGQAIASLEVREPSTFVDQASRVGRLTACLVALLLGVAWLDDRSMSPVVPWCVALLLITAALVEWQQRRIVLRARPALPADLAAADTAFRGEAIMALHHAGNGLVCLLLANAFAAVDDRSGLSALIGIGLLVVAVVNWRRSRIWIAPRSATRFGTALS